MVLSDRDLKKRLRTLADVGLSKDVLGDLQRGEVPKKLDEALSAGRIIIDPMPADECFDADTIDLCFGHVVEIPDTPLELTEIEGKPVIRRFTVDFRADRAPRRLDQLRKVAIIDQSRVRFILEDEETLELQPGMMALVHTLELICVPYDLQMQIGGRSRIARSYISVHVSSPVLHPGWCGHAVMEAKNDGPFSFNAFPGLRFAQVHFVQMSSQPERPYLKKPGAKYSGQR